jgi:hypothetical protein
MQIYVLSVNMSSGILPLGLQARDFPALLMQNTFCETNLEELPADLNLKWPRRTSVFVENSKLTSVPLSLVRMQPYYLVLSTTELLPELFSFGLQTIVVGKTLVRELLQNVNPADLVRHENRHFVLFYEAFLGMYRYPFLAAGRSSIVLHKQL